MKQQGLAIFMRFWFAQLTSHMGLNMTKFALLIWTYQLTGQATTMVLLGFFNFGAMVVASPLAGYWVDRLNRRQILIYTQLSTGLMLATMLIIIGRGELALWHLYVAQVILGAIEAFKNPANTAITSALIPKAHYGRANGLRYLGTSIAEGLAPVVAGAILVWAHLEVVIVLHLMMSVVASIILMRTTFSAKPHQNNQKAESFWQQFVMGWHYIRQRKGLLGLIAVGVIVEFSAALAFLSIFPAMILARTGGDELALSAVQGAIGVGGVLGSIAMSIWGGPTRKIHGVLGFTALSYLFGDFFFGIGQNTAVWMISGVATAFFFPFMIGCEMSIWQSKVPVQMQGRVLAMQQGIRYFALPIGYILGGLLADHVFEPAMVEGQWLANAFGWLVGTGDGAGMALMFIMTGTIGLVTGIGGYGFTFLRNIEADLPDHDHHPVPQSQIA